MTFQKERSKYSYLRYKGRIIRTLVQELMIQEESGGMGCNEPEWRGCICRNVYVHDPAGKFSQVRKMLLLK